MKKHKFLKFLLLSFFLSIFNPSIAKASTQMGVTPGVIKVDLCEQEEASASLELTYNGDKKEILIECEVEEDKSLFQEDEFPKVQLSEDKFLIKNGEKHNLNLTVSSPTNTSKKEFIIDIVLNMRDDSLNGTLRVPLIVKNSNNLKRNVVLENTKIQSNASLLTDYKNLFKGVLTFNKSLIKNSFAAITNNTYIINLSDNEKLLDLGKSYNVPLKEVLSVDKNNISYEHYIYLESQPKLNDYIKHISIDDTSDSIILTADKDYKMQFNYCSPTIIKQSLYDLSDRLSGKIKYTDILDYIKVPNNISYSKINISSRLSNEGEISEEPILNYSYYTDSQSDNPLVIKNSFLLLKNSSKTLTTQLNTDNLDKTDKKIIINETVSNINQDINTEYTLRLCKVRYLPMVSVSLFLIVLLIFILIVIKKVKNKKIQLKI